LTPLLPLRRHFRFQRCFSPPAVFVSYFAFRWFFAFSFFAFQFRYFFFLLSFSFIDFIIDIDIIDTLYYILLRLMTLHITPLFHYYHCFSLADRLSCFH
jgi:hypothetical protein